MKLPRGVSGEELATALGRVGYQVVRQRGSHMRLHTERAGSHSVVVPAHRALKPGMLNAILKQVADHLGMTREELIEILKI